MVYTRLDDGHRSHFAIFGQQLFPKGLITRPRPDVWDIEMLKTSPDPTLPIREICSTKTSPPVGSPENKHIKESTVHTQTHYDILHQFWVEALTHSLA